MDIIEEILGAEFDVDAATRELALQNPILRVSEAERRDRVRGMLFGVALGDALGGPHEFRWQKNLDQYTGITVHPLAHQGRFQGKRVGAVGQITDDTEMTIALAHSILLAGRYEKDHATLCYIEWANSRTPFMGRNTRALFKGIKTVKGFGARLALLRAEPDPSEWSQSNGCLMRAAPLATISDDGAREAAVIADCSLSNFHPVCIDAVQAYVCAAHELLRGATPAAATASALRVATEAGVVVAIATGQDREPRDVGGRQKGWILHALYCAFYALNHPSPSYQDRIDIIIRFGGDTDTNGAIAGALLGAQLGAAAMSGESRTGPNLDTVLACDTSETRLPRPQKYAAARLPVLADALASL